MDGYVGVCEIGGKRRREGVWVACVCVRIRLSQCTVLDYLVDNMTLQTILGV